MTYWACRLRLARHADPTERIALIIQARSDPSCQAPPMGSVSAQPPQGSGAVDILDDGYVYGWCGVTKRLIDIDDELLNSAARELGTSGVSDTVRTALRRAATAVYLRPRGSPQRSD